jgi:hypothetical protein
MNVNQRYETVDVTYKYERKRSSNFEDGEKAFVETGDCLMSFKVFTAASIKMTAFWDIASCSLVEVDRRFRVLTVSVIRRYQEAVRMSRSKMAVFWVVAPCSLVEIYQHFRGPCCLHHQGDE